MLILVFVGTILLLSWLCDITGKDMSSSSKALSTSAWISAEKKSISWMALMELLPIYMTCSVGGTDTVALRTVSFKFWFWTDVIEVLLLRELLRQSDISLFFYHSTCLNNSLLKPHFYAPKFSWCVETQHQLHPFQLLKWL